VPRHSRIASTTSGGTGTVRVLRSVFGTLNTYAPSCRWTGLRAWEAHAASEAISRDDRDFWTKGSAWIDA